MSLYSIKKLINETRRLAAEFKRTTGTMLPVSGEIARFDVSHHLGLTLCQENNCSYDAIGKGQRDGQRVLIKSRVIGDKVKPGHRIGQLNLNGEWDIIIISLMDNEFEPVEMYQLSREKILIALPENNRKRGSLSVAKIRNVGERVWCREHSIDELPLQQNVI